MMPSTSVSYTMKVNTIKEPVSLDDCPLLLHSQSLLKCALGWHQWGFQHLVWIQPFFLFCIFCLFPNPKSLSLLAPLPSTLTASIMPCHVQPSSPAPTPEVHFEVWTGQLLHSGTHRQGLWLQPEPCWGQSSALLRQIVAELRPTGQLLPLTHNP